MLSLDSLSYVGRNLRREVFEMRKSEYCSRLWNIFLLSGCTVFCLLLFVAKNSMYAKHIRHDTWQFVIGFPIYLIGRRICKEFNRTNSIQFTFQVPRINCSIQLWSQQVRQFVILLHVNENSSSSKKCRKSSTHCLKYINGIQSRYTVARCFTWHRAHLARLEN